MTAHDSEAPSWSRFYVPEIHDVHPQMEADVDTLLSSLPERARDVCALLVVPNWQETGVLTAEHPLSQVLKAHPGPKVLHGWTHSLGPSLKSRIMYGHDDRGEFARITAEEARRRLDQSSSAFSQCIGSTPQWFCAPQSQQSPAATRVLAEQGPRNTMLSNRLVLEDGVEVPFEVVSFDVGARRLIQTLHLRYTRKQVDALMAAGTPFRLSLHPADYVRPHCWQVAETVMNRLEAEGWEAVGLDEAAVRWRALKAA